MKIATNLYLPLVLVLINTPFGVLFSQELDSVVANGLSGHFISYMNNLEFHKAAKLFHYPPDYDSDELANDVIAVSRSLRLFSEEFGAVSIKDSASIWEEAIYVSVSGGDITYWSKHPRSVSVDYSVNFSNARNGTLRFSFCHLNNKWEIRKVYFGLSRSSSDAENRLATLMVKMLQLSKQLQQ